MLAAPLCPKVNAVASDGGPVRITTAIAGRGAEWRFPRWLSRFFAWLIVAFTSLRLRANLFSYDSVRWVRRIAPRPSRRRHVAFQVSATRRRAKCIQRSSTGE
jgi:hypothetical protein